LAIMEKSPTLETSRTILDRVFLKNELPDYQMELGYFIAHLGEVVANKQTVQLGAVALYRVLEQYWPELKSPAASV
jgi:hypothetical protein